MQSTTPADPSATVRPERVLLDAFDFLIRLYVSKAGPTATRTLIRALRDDGRIMEPVPEHHLMLARRLERTLSVGTLAGFPPLPEYE